jgi:hypothetical protein
MAARVVAAIKNPATAVIDDVGATSSFKLHRTYVEEASVLQLILAMSVPRTAMEYSGRPKFLCRQTNLSPDSLKLGTGSAPPDR